MIETNTITIDLTIAMVTALLGLAYPLFIDKISAITDKYQSRRITNKFKRECAYMLFNYLMVICILEMFTFPAIIAYIGSETLGIILISIQNISVFVLSMCMVVLYHRILTYTEPTKLLDRIRANELSQEQFEDIVEIIQMAASDRTQTEIYNSCVSDLVTHIMEFQQQELRKQHELKK